MSEIVNIDYVERLRFLRLESHLTYAEFARAIGLSKASLSRYESGAWPLPRKVELAILGFQETRGGQRG